LYIEDEGVPTVNISLVREHTEAIRPPRALWVPFMLGRPLGVPDDAAFQRRVVLAALRLFERDRGPVLEDYPEEAPTIVSVEEMEGMACAIDFSSDRTDVPLPTLVIEEISQLRSWYDVALAKRGRTSLGVAGAPLEDLVRYLGSWLAGEPSRPYRDDLPVSNALRLACEELKVFYFEANAGQPGVRSVEAVQHWFWHETAAGKFFAQVRVATENNADREIRHFATENLLPRVARHTG
jgi:hypothetical protein